MNRSRAPRSATKKTTRRTQSGAAAKRSTKRPSRAAAALHVLADRMGIIGEYVDQTGKETRRTSDATRRALLGVMGIDARDDRSAKRALERLDAEERAHLVEPVCVARIGAPFPELGLRLPEARSGEMTWRLTVTGERGAIVGRSEGSAAGDAGSVAIRYPVDPAPGYYDVVVTLETTEGTVEGRQFLVIVPGVCPSPHDVTRGMDVFGIFVNLYTLHSGRSWGIGNLADLSALTEWAARSGASFIGLNPLHALFNRDGHVSPYSPVSRLFGNPLYLHIPAIPELAESGEARALVDSLDVRTALAAVRSSERIEYERVAGISEPVLQALHRAFVRRHRGRTTKRGRAFAAYVASQGEGLERFATFMALDRHFTKQTRGRRVGTPWRRWPRGFRDPGSPEVRAFREANADAVDYHRYLQFELDRQLGEAADTARESGMPIGLYQDLAIGSSPDGCDAWAWPDLFLRGASIGAPPDPYSASGQNWGLPPIDPRRLRYDRYRYWIQLIRASLRHGGALRIDHVMGLFRQFWIPEGESGDKGAYVRFPSDELLGILTLEATRAGTIVVGEDLGTVPPDVPPALEERGILSSKVVYFERTSNGSFNPAASYAPLALATVNTHDMPTMAGWWEGRDIVLRNDAGLLGRGGDPEAREVKEAFAVRQRERKALLRRLVADGALPDADPPASSAALTAAVHRWLCTSPSMLVGLALDDIAGERDPVNLPGVGPDVFPSWTRKLGIALEELSSGETFQAVLGCERRSRH